MTVSPVKGLSHALGLVSWTGSRNVSVNLPKIVRICDEDGCKMSDLAATR